MAVMYLVTGVYKILTPTRGLNFTADLNSNNQTSVEKMDDLLLPVILSTPRCALPQLL